MGNEVENVKRGRKGLCSKVYMTWNTLYILDRPRAALGSPEGVVMAEQKENSVPDEAKGVAGDLLRTLGILDLVIGSLFTYLIWLLDRDAIGELFPTTGYAYLDVGLLGCAAAFLGKVVNLLASLAISLLSLLTGSYENTLDTEYKSFCERTKRPVPLEKSSICDQAAVGVAVVNPSLRKVFDRKSDNALISATGALLGILFLIHLIRSEAAGLLIVGDLLLVILFSFLAWAHYVDGLRHLTHALRNLEQPKQ